MLELAFRPWRRLISDKCCRKVTFGRRLFLAPLRAPAFKQNEIPLKKHTNSSTSSHPPGRPKEVPGRGHAVPRIACHCPPFCPGNPVSTVVRLRDRPINLRIKSGEGDDSSVVSS